MRGSAVYGLLLGLLFIVLTRLAPQPIGSLILWGALALQSGWMAWLLLRRTRMYLASAAMIMTTNMAILLMLAAVRGQTFPELSIEFAVPSYALMLEGLVLMAVAARVHRREWEAWRSFMQGKSAWDLVLGRHVPEQRQEAADR